MAASENTESTGGGEIGVLLVTPLISGHAPVARVARHPRACQRAGVNVSGMEPEANGKRND